MSDEKQDGVIFTPKVEEEGRIDEFPTLNEQPLISYVTSGKTEPDLLSIIPPEEIKPKVEVEEKNNVAIDNAADDLNIKTYVKITSTFYIKPAGTEKNKEGEEVKLYKILNPETNVVEKRPLTDTEKHDIFVRDLKESHIKFHPIKNATKTIGVTTVTSSIGRKRQIKDKETQTNLTTNQFGADYHKKRKRKNQIQKKSRKANRKK